MDQWQQQAQGSDARQHETVDRQHEDQPFDDSAEQRRRHLDDRQNLHRMKRHPELQPFVPSDRFTVLSAGQPSLSSINKLNQQGGGSRTLTNQNKASQKNTPTTTPTGNDAFGQPKRYCSMTRLNQLAKPKMRTTTNVQNVVSSATLSTNSSSRSINSINKNLDKQRESKLLKAKEQQPSKPSRRDEKQTNTSKQRQQQQQQTKRPAEAATQKAPTRKSLETQQKQTPRVQQQPQQQKQKQSLGKLSDRPPITPITSVKPSVMNTPISPTAVMNTETPQSSTPVVVRDTKIASGTRPSLTPAVHLPTPASSLEEELESATKSNRNDITRDIVIEPSINEQMSEMSLNDPFYQSAASELVPESENSTNGINYDRNAESLCRELQEDLLANGFISHIDQDEFKSPVSNGRDNSPRRASVATITTSENLAPSETSQQISEDDDRRLKIEKELRDKAKQEDDDRRKREEIVENILSRFSQGSVS